MALERKLKMQILQGDETQVVNFNNVNPTANYTTLNTAMRNLSDLAQGTYIDTHVIDTQSLNELVS